MIDGYKKGLTTVELLVTLFIASAFILAGHQLYTQVLLRGTESNRMANASMAAYKYMRKYQNDVKTTKSICSPETLVSNQPVSDSDLPDGKLTVTVKCPMTAASISDIHLVTSTITYKKSSSGTESVSHAGYIR
ncbi:hypothetical protein H6796_02390 [Candidatus Nomurabacteria bacterium]|nr:hypothetical protein [Candidatus Nomurabacteria bacterium]